MRLLKIFVYFLLYFNLQICYKICLSTAPFLWVYLSVCHKFSIAPLVPFKIHHHHPHHPHHLHHHLHYYHPYHPHRPSATLIFFHILTELTEQSFIIFFTITLSFLLSTSKKKIKYEKLQEKLRFLSVVFFTCFVSFFFFGRCIRKKSKLKQTL